MGMRVGASSKDEDEDRLLVSLPSPVKQVDRSEGEGG